MGVDMSSLLVVVISVRSWAGLSHVVHVGVDHVQQVSLAGQLHHRRVDEVTVRRMLVQPVKQVTQTETGYSN